MKTELSFSDRIFILGKRLFPGVLAFGMELLAGLLSSGFSDKPEDNKSADNDVTENKSAVGDIKEETTAFDTQSLEFFQKQVKPILQAKCFSCHGGKKNVKGGLRLTSRAGILKGGESGPAVSEKDPDESLLLAAINYQDYEMPPQGKLPQKQIEILTRWVKMKLPWPPGVDFGAKAEKKEGPPVVDEHTKQFWSFQPVNRPNVPAVKNKKWVKTPIDAFILAKLDAAGLTPSNPAAKTELLRRAYYDLTGLPPEPKDVDAFLADHSPAAFETVIDRLLESPHYGERWGRHWLDLVRYAETNSYERDGVKPFVWRYRDYIIRSFNEDKPYDRFIREQIAGDELKPATPDGIIATGYYRLGIWDDEPSDPEQALYDDLDDIISTTGQIFLGLTVGCARCHDHKLDPFPQQDYYSFLAFFRNIRRYGVRKHDTVLDASVRLLSSPKKQKEYQRLIAEHHQKQKDNQRELKAIERLVRNDFIGVEKDEFKNEQARIEILKKRVPKLLSEEQFQEYVSLTQHRDELQEFKAPEMVQALCVKEHGNNPPVTHVLIRGNPHAPGKAVQPGFPSVLSPEQPRIPDSIPKAESSGRRLTLANWLASADNPLASRVMVNRIWQYHFGRGIVRTPSNFGYKGMPPTHPKLLDWLAAEFVERGWRMKHMHKLIMLSNAYQQSSRVNETALAKDTQNDLFWRFNMRRLEAEELRDSLLAVNGRLNRKKMFGPSIYTVIPAEVLAGQSRPGSGWGKSSREDRYRRSIYIHVKRSLIVPMMESFDAADVDSSCPVRFSTTQPTQALGMLNGDFLNDQAAAFAKYIKTKAGNDSATQVKLVLKRTLQRNPTQQEIQRGLQLIQLLKDEHNVSDPMALKLYCVVALNLNEFLYLD